MNQRQKDRLKKFVTALRSGDYQQGRHQLHWRSSEGKDFYCCLGVACEVALKNRVKLEVVVDNYDVYYDGERGFLPNKVVEYYGLPTSNPLIQKNGSRTTATEANDVDQYNFNQIADMFEQTYLVD